MTLDKYELLWQLTFVSTIFPTIFPAFIFCELFDFICKSTKLDFMSIGNLFLNFDKLSSSL